MESDGRRLKGEQRKRELIAATLKVVADQGVAGVSHRVVAKEAGLPATAAAYHFDGIDDLLAAALTEAMNIAIAEIREIAADPDPDAAIRRMAESMADVVRDSGRLVAEFELYLLAARKPALLPAVRGWMDVISEFARRYLDDPLRVLLVVGAFDGLMLQALLMENPPQASEFEGLLRVLLQRN
ncbi:TetR family transcriptional regulator [Pseudonocardiaceae bacterium YIM PH 21723]|nr:TetR family transcriptional regulator [Pseudonocardiaceae bacterium YIM PH 21723]